MIVGLSMFDTVLERLNKERADEPTPRQSSWTGIRGLNSSFVGALTGQGSRGSRDELAAAYSDFAGDAIAPMPKPKAAIDVSIFKRVSAEEIAKEIKLLPTDTPFELQSKRRSFARANHPDRIPEEWRDAATTRMKIANQMIDDALRTAREKQA